MSDFQYFVMEDGKFVNEAKNKGNKILAGRLNRITDYMYDNYSRKLTLNEIDHTKCTFSWIHAGTESAL